MKSFVLSTLVFLMSISAFAAESTTNQTSVTHKLPKPGQGGLLSLQISGYVRNREEGNPELAKLNDDCRLEKPIAVGYADASDIILFNLQFTAGASLPAGNAIFFIGTSHETKAKNTYGIAYQTHTSKFGGKTGKVFNTDGSDDIAGGFMNGYNDEQASLELLKSLGFVAANATEADVVRIVEDTADSYTKESVQNYWFNEEYKDFGASGKYVTKIINGTYAFKLRRKSSDGSLELLRSYLRIENNQIVSVKIQSATDETSKSALCLKSADMADVRRDADYVYLMSFLPK